MSVNEFEWNKVNLFTLMSMVNIVVRIYILQNDAESGKFTLISMLNIVVRIYILQNDAESGKCTLMSMVIMLLGYSSCKVMQDQGNVR